MMSMVAPVTALPVVGGRRATRRGRSLVSVRAMSQETTSKSLEIMRKFSEQYAKRSGTYFCMDKSVTAVVIKGLAEHKDELGAPLCPCRHYDDKQAEADQGFWNCPCVPMRERKECHCMLFLTEDNDFRGDEQEITIDEVVQMTEGM
ncbi:Ferredoxin-thioredoxin reductase catalytic chain [Picochlorum sp. SENEW3]|nr:Ferredoxin-thioredoxin reductase catalytic chain [Picochlorum sp. SENEW3]|mmetsp:Transcript_2205/g.4525  ORF Transcript_2205/g.4525 Transcript_2205/m.4525 type:complete len:147 (-) Transcript_2205:100-540(-)|eukprot:jgi/Picre1/35543/NNA_003004.t1